MTRSGSSGQPDKVWGQFGSGKGDFQRPRAIAVDDQDQLYIVDMTARIQVFDRDGNYQRGWQTPASTNGRPSGLAFDLEGNLLVADTHYFRVLVYRPDGQQLEERTLGGNAGLGPGEFNFVTEALQTRDGCYYVSEYGNADRIQKLDPTGKFLLQWGTHGDQPGQFNRPNNMVLDADELLWVVDSCNHRVQVFDLRSATPQLARIWGEAGKDPGQLYYPYDLALDGRGHLYLTEFGNHRVQKFTLDGQWRETIGGPGREPGQFAQPWALAFDSLGTLHVLDSYNHRVQRFRT